MSRMIVFCVTRYKEAWDVARHVISTSLENIGNSLQNARDSLKQNFSNFMNGDKDGGGSVSGSSGGSSVNNGINGTGIKNNTNVVVTAQGSGGGGGAGAASAGTTTVVDNSGTAYSSASDSEMEINPYLDDDAVMDQEIDNSDSINAQIEAGSKIKD